MAPVHMLLAGWSCKDLSRLNSSRSSRSLAGQTGTSATTLQSLLLHLDSHRPSYFLWENVTSLADTKAATGARRSASSRADADTAQLDDFDNLQFLFDALRSLRYDARIVRLSPTNAWIPQNRARLWVFGTQIKEGSADLLDAFVATVDKLALPPGSDLYDLDSFLLPEHHPRVQDAVGAARSKVGAGESIKGGKLHCKWPTQHEVAFADSGKALGPLSHCCKCL